MSKILTQIETIKEFLRSFPTGASIKEIEKIMIQKGYLINRKALQRRLSKLKNQGDIITIGQSRNIKYQLISKKVSLKNYQINMKKQSHFQL